MSENSDSKSSLQQDQYDQAQAFEQMFRMTTDIKNLLEQRERALAAVHHAHLETLKRLARAAEFKDDDTGTHIQRMSEFSRMIAEAYGKNDDYCELILRASPMHDIGKIGIPDSVLKKPGKLTDEEFSIMKKHPEFGFEILTGSDVPVLEMAAEIALTHHEKFDGSGYPYARKGDQIALSGRIVALADFFDALTMDRCYRKAFADDVALNMVRENSGTHFDPKVVEAFYSVKDRIIEKRDAINALA